MKKNGLLLVLVLIIGMLSNIQAQTAIKSGFSIKSTFTFPSSAVENSAYFGCSMLYGIELGNRWYFSPNETFGFGLMVNWLDVSVGIDEYEEIIMNFTLPEMGCIGTYALSDDMAIDGYYNVGPTALLALDSDDIPIGFQHTLGAAFRYHVLNVGIEKVFGSVSDNDRKMKINAFRFFIGVKF